MRRAGGDLLQAHDARFDRARRDLRAEPRRRRLGGVEADQFAARRLERRFDAVKAIDARHLGVSPLARPVAPRRALRLRLRRRGPRLVIGAGVAAPLALRPMRRGNAPIAFAGHRGETPSGLYGAGRRFYAPSSPRAQSAPAASARKEGIFQLTGRRAWQHKPGHRASACPGRFRPRPSARMRGSVPSGKGGGL